MFQNVVRSRVQIAKRYAQGGGMGFQIRLSKNTWPPPGDLSVVSREARMRCHKRTRHGEWPNPA
jgi:hypothetical protein